MKKLLTWRLPRWRDATTGMKLAYVFIITLNVINVTHTILELRREIKWEKEQDRLINQTMRLES